MSKTLDNVFNNSKRYKINDKTKLVIMSDCHRGNGNNHDNFVKNKDIYESALMQYYNRGFTYIELGDGDELWKVLDYKDIINEHFNTFKILRKFHNDNKLIMIYGNHDIIKKSPNILDDLYKYYNKEIKINENLLNNLIVYEALVLDYDGHEIFLTHGHQIDRLNSNFWKLSRFLVRHLWMPLENIGIKNPVGAAKNYKVEKRVEKKLEKWSIKNNKILIAGHTHRPIFPEVGKSLYFNDGSCIHPNGITCIEIEDGNITLAKWVLELNDNQTISAVRKIVEGREPIKNFFLK